MALMIVSLVVSFYTTWFLFKYYCSIWKYRSRCRSDGKKNKHFSNTVEIKRETDFYENVPIDTMIQLSNGSESISTKINGSVGSSTETPTSKIDNIQKESDFNHDTQTQVTKTDQFNAIAEDNEQESNPQTVATSYAPGITFSFTFSGGIRMGSLQSTMAHVDFNVNTEPKKLNISSQPNGKNPTHTASLSSQTSGTSGPLSSAAQIETFASAAEIITQNLATAMRTAFASASASLMANSETTGQSNASILDSGGQANSKQPLETPDKNSDKMIESSGQKCSNTPEFGTPFGVTGTSDKSAADDKEIPKNFSFNDPKQENLVFGQTTSAIPKSMFSFPLSSPNLAKSQLTPAFGSFCQVIKSEENKTSSSAFGFDYPGPSSGRKKTNGAFHYCFADPNTSEGKKTLPGFSFGLPVTSSEEEKTTPVFNFGSSTPDSGGKKITRPPVSRLKLNSNNKTSAASIFANPSPTSNKTRKDNNKSRPSTFVNPFALAILERNKTTIPESISSKSNLSFGRSKSQERFNGFDPPLSGVINPFESKVPFTAEGQAGQIAPSSVTPTEKIVCETGNSNSLNTLNFKTQSSTGRKAEIVSM